MSSFFMPIIATPWLLDFSITTAAVQARSARESEFVLQPATLTLDAALGRQLRPVKIHFRLVFAPNHERNRFRELKMRTAVQRRESLAVELKGEGRVLPFGLFSSGTRNSWMRREFLKMLR